MIKQQIIKDKVGLDPVEVTEKAVEVEQKMKAAVEQ